MRILLTEGSGLTSRQVATRLGQSGHEVEILSSAAICLTRFTRHVRQIHRVPAFGQAPLDWLDAAETIARERKIDLLFPTQEQVTVISARRHALTCPSVVPDFSSLVQVQDKIAAFNTLRAAGLPQPPTVVVESEDDLARIVDFPVFVKRPVSTASSGVVKADDAEQLQTAVRALQTDARDALIVQQQCRGPLAMVQAVADNGRLVAHHACLRVQEGAGGSAAIKDSIVLPTMPDHLQRLVGHLRWHGPISLDVIVTEAGPMVIDVNPRLVEPINAYLAGVDLVGAMLSLAAGRSVAPQPAGRAGVRSHQLLLAVLGAAQQQGVRRAVVTEVVSALRRTGSYARSVEELTPLSGDPLAAVPVVAAVLATLTKPDAWRLFHRGAVGPYALTPKAWAEIVALANGT